MIVLHIEGVKEFMEQLFYGDMFDRFHVKDCEVATFTVFRIDGRRQDEWYDTDEREGDGTGFVTWNQLKPYVAEWIKGKKKPRKMEMNFWVFARALRKRAVAFIYRIYAERIFAG